MTETYIIEIVKQDKDFVRPNLSIQELDYLNNKYQDNLWRFKNTQDVWNKWYMFILQNK